MAHPAFDHADFLDAALALVAKHGPAAVTVAAITARLRAPTGSFYHRFASRDALLGELWLNTVKDFQQGIAAAKQAVSRASNSAPAHYYLGMDLAQLAQTKSLGALKLVGQMERAARLAHGDTTQGKLDKLDGLLAQTSTSSQDVSLFADMLSLT